MGTGARSNNNSIGQALSTSPNSLNLVRLLLAAAVIFSHAMTLGGYRSEVVFHSTLGVVAVYGFFGISGYLIAGSAAKNNVGRYLWHRCLRIFPAYWVCLAVTAAVFGWIGWLHWGHSCVFWCYVKQPDGPVGYVVHNSWLRLNQLSIGETLRGIPLTSSWNGSLWTLFYEFLCYLLLGALAVVGLLRHRLGIVILAAALWTVELILTAVPSFNSYFRGAPFYETALLSLVPIFLVGAAIYSGRDRVPDSGWIALGCVVAACVGSLISVGYSIPVFTLTRSNVVAPLLVYPTLWLGAHLPWPQIGARNDYSYGIYIYAFPVAQILALWGVYRAGYLVYTALTLIMTGAFAAASWWLIEKHALRLKDLAVPWRTVGTRVADDDESPGACHAEEDGRQDAEPLI
ncbi:MAG: acyltransferase [Acidimicrobiales bacterium]|jgi:peptidoglycan/LPS O-acetylase OafA/YrhL